MKKILSVLLITLATALAYAPAVHDGFVWDDTALILRDPLIRSWRLIPEGFNHFLFTDATASDFYRPIQRLTYTLEYAAFGAHPPPYHAVSILCHLAAALAFFFAALELLKLFGLDEPQRTFAATAAALVWAIHPAHSSAVIYISGRADPLAGAFGFFGLYLGLRARERNDGKRWALLFGATLAFLLSALSKEAGLIFPLLWCAVALLRTRRWDLLTAVSTAIVVGICYATLRLPAEHVSPPITKAPPPLLVRPIIASRALAEYAALIIFPRHLRMERGVETHPTGFGDASLNASAWRELETLGGMIIGTALSFWAVRARRRAPAIFSMLVLAAVSYAPISGLFSLNAALAEHWIYLPSAFLFLAAALELVRLRARPTPNRSSRLLFRAAAMALPLWIVFLGARTFIRTFDWKDQRTFFERTIASGGDSARMLINLAGVEMNEGRLAEAKTHLETALRQEPAQPLAVLNLAAVAIKQNDYRAAHGYLQRALKFPAVEAEAHELLVVLANKEDGKVDLLRLRLASRTGAPNWMIEKRYVKVLAESGYPGRAIDELRACLKTQWYRAESWQLLSELLSQTGQQSEAAQAHATAEAYDTRLAERPRVL